MATAVTTLRIGETPDVLKVSRFAETSLPSLHDDATVVELDEKLSAWIVGSANLATPKPSDPVKALSRSARLDVNVQGFRSARAVHDLVEGIHMKDEELTGRFDGIDQRFDAMDQRFDATDQRFDAMDHRFDHLMAFVKEEGATTRRHFDVVAEAMQTEVKLVAEGHGALQKAVAGVKVRVDRVETRQDHVEDRQLALEHRQGKLEK